MQVNLFHRRARKTRLFDFVLRVDLLLLYMHARSLIGSSDSRKLRVGVLFMVSQRPAHSATDRKLTQEPRVSTDRGVQHLDELST